MMQPIFFNSLQIGGFLSTKESQKKINTMFEAVFSYIEKIRLVDILSGDIFMPNALFMCKALCGLGFLYHIYQNGYSNLLNLELKSFFKLWQPIAIFVGIAMYDTLILLLEHLLSKVNLFVTHSFEDQSIKVSASVSKLAAAKAELAAKSEKGFSFFGINFSSKGPEVKGITQSILDGLYNLFCDVIAIIAYICRFWILLKRVFFLSILTITGVISLTISIFPPFSDSFNAWLQKYVGIWMWLPMVTVIDWILACVNQKTALGGDQDKLIGLIFSFFSITAYMMIPEFCNWIVSGSSSAVSQFNRTSVSNAKRAAGVAKKGGSLLMKNPKVRAAAQALKIIKKS